MELGLFKDPGVQRGHAVDRVAEVDVHVGHVDHLVPVQDGHLLVVGAGAGGFIQLFDDRHELGHHIVQVGAGPLFQRFGQDGVVGVGADIGDDAAGFLKFDAPLPQQSARS